MKRTPVDATVSRRVLVFVDESNVTSSAKAANRKLDWISLRDHLIKGRELIEMVVYVGLPPAMSEWQSERDKKSKFLFWLRSHGFMVVEKDGTPGDGTHYKANVDVLMAIDGVELSDQMNPDVVILVTGDADFAHLALRLRRRGIRVEVASVGQVLGAGLKTAANEVIDLAPLLAGFDPLVG
ncbi:MAG: NYN domain-containing protein [Verrucomicrobiota bacterium]